MKVLRGFVFLSAIFTTPIQAEVITLLDVKINEISVYDDYQDGVVFLGLSKAIGTCNVGAYLNPNLPPEVFNRLYALSISSATTKQNLKIQLYDDRTVDGRCEIDAIRAFY